MPLRLLVVPLLVLRQPDLLRPAVAAGEDPVDVAVGERAVGVDVGELGVVGGDGVGVLLRAGCVEFGQAPGFGEGLRGWGAAGSGLFGHGKTTVSGLNDEPYGNCGPL